MPVPRQHLLALSVLAACAAAVADPAAADVAAHLDSVRAQASPSGSLAAPPAATAVAPRARTTAQPQEPVRSTPAPAPQEPQEPERASPKIDQLQPADLQARHFHSARRPLALTVEFGLGTQKVVARGSTLHDRTTAQQLRVGLDTDPGAAVGGGMQLRARWSADDLFAGALINDGVAPAAADAEATSYGAFPHLRLTDTFADWELVTRVGVSVDRFVLDHEAAAVDRSWLTVGARVQGEARLPLHGAGDARLELFGRLGGQLGYGWFEEDYGIGESGDSAGQWGIDAGVGLRWREGSWSLCLGYEWGQSRLLATDAELFGDRSSVLDEHQMVFVGGSFVF